MCRFACKIVMELKRFSALAERLHSQTLNGLDARFSSLHTGDDSDRAMVKRPCNESDPCARDQQLFVSAAPEEDSEPLSTPKPKRKALYSDLPEQDSAPHLSRKRQPKALDGVAGNIGIKIDATHHSKSTLSVAGTPCMPGLRLDTAAPSEVSLDLSDCACTADRFAGRTHMSGCVVQDLSEAQCQKVDPPEVCVIESDDDDDESRYRDCASSLSDNMADCGDAGGAHASNCINENLSEPRSRKHESAAVCVIVSDDDDQYISRECARLTSYRRDCGRAGSSACVSEDLNEAHCQKMETREACMMKPEKDDRFKSRECDALNDYLTECWDEDLEAEIIRCSDASAFNNRSEPKDAMANHEANVVIGEPMPDNRWEPTAMEPSPLQSIAGMVGEQPANPLHNVSQLHLDRQEGSDILYEVIHRPLMEEEAELSGDTCSPHLDCMPLKFSLQQMEVLEAVASGKSVFITGSAGTGKSFLLMYIIRMLKKAVGSESVYVTASTGLAACALNGITLHSFAGIGLGCGERESLAGRVLHSKEARKRWSMAKVLIIDEISMIDGELFDCIEYVARRVRRTERCFGGIQLIVTGDFFQLPPVNPPNHRKFFAFEAECWNQCFDLQVELAHAFRQSDGAFVKMLNEIRKGVPSPETLVSLSECYRALPDDGTEIAPTRLYPLKVDVQHENMQELKALQTVVVTYHSVDSVPNRLHRFMLKGMRTEKELQLCVGAQVMLIKNLDTGSGLVNGAKGVVIGFESSYSATPENEKEEDRKELRSAAKSVSPLDLWPVVRFGCGVRTIGPKKESAEEGGMEVASRIQVPLILAWALSVHKCQGMTLSKVQTDLSKAFAFGMVYVALSRVKDLDGLQLIGFDPTRIKVHPNVVSFFDKLVDKV